MTSVMLRHPYIRYRRDLTSDSTACIVGTATAPSPSCDGFNVNSVSMWMVGSSAYLPVFTAISVLTTCGCRVSIGISILRCTSTEGWGRGRALAAVTIVWMWSLGLEVRRWHGSTEMARVFELSVIFLSLRVCLNHSCHSAVASVIGEIFKNYSLFEVATELSRRF